MAEKDLLDAALDEFEDPEEETKTQPTQSLQETLEQAENAANASANPLGDFNFSELEDMMNKLAGEIEANPELKADLENIGSQFMQENVVLQSMQEIRDKLKTYITQHRAELAPDVLSRYEGQLQVYNNICQEFQNENEGRAMELISSLQSYGDLPPEIVPPMPEECRLF